MSQRQRVDLLVDRQELKQLDRLAAEMGETRTALIVLAMKGLVPEIVEPAPPKENATW